jgi:hypothetical protein
VFEAAVMVELGPRVLARGVVAHAGVGLDVSFGSLGLRDRGRCSIAVTASAVIRVFISSIPSFFEIKESAGT